MRRNCQDIGSPSLCLAELGLPIWRIVGACAKRRSWPERVGAWVIKCNPQEIYDISDPGSGLWDPRTANPVDDDVEWSLGATYRSAEIAPGDRCFFWVSGDVSRKWGSGLWAECDVLAVARAGRGGGPWIDTTRMRRTVPYLPTHLRFLPRPVAKDVIRSHPGLVDSELVKTPNRTNPVALTRAEVAILDRLINNTPDPPAIVSRGRRPPASTTTP